MQTYFIYALGDPRDGELRYVGCSINPVNRHYAHYTANYVRSIHQWNDELKQLGLKPVLACLQSTEAIDMPRDLEASWITKLIQRGHRLLNQQNRRGRTPDVARLSDDEFSAAMKQVSATLLERVA
jgi:hypothetical protein